MVGNKNFEKEESTGEEFSRRGNEQIFSWLGELLIPSVRKTLHFFILSITLASPKKIELLWFALCYQPENSEFATECHFNSPSSLQIFIWQKI